MAVASQSLSVNQMYEKLLQNGEVESNSPKNRLRLYRLLQLKKIPFETKIIGYTSGEKSLSRWSGYKMGWDLGRIIKWIESGRLTREELQRCCDLFNQYDCKPRAELSDIENVFNKELNREQKCQLIKNNWDEILDYKWTPFDYCMLKKTIVRITLVK